MASRLGNPSRVGRLLGSASMLIFSGCSQVLPGPSYEIFMMCRIDAGARQIDSSFEVLAGWGPHGLFTPRGEPNFHDRPDSNGIVFIRTFTRTYDYGERAQEDSLHLSAAPLGVLIDHPDFRRYQDTFGVDRLRGLPRISPEEAGIRLGETQVGVWVLPDIRLAPKE